MPKLVLEVITNGTPSENDVLVFSKKAQAWVQIPKVSFLTEVNSEISDLKKQLEETNKKVEKAQQDVSFMANTLKERVKKESVK